MSNVISVPQALTLSEAVDEWDANSRLRMIIEGALPDDMETVRHAYKHDLLAINSLIESTAEDVRAITGRAANHQTVPLRRDNPQAAYDSLKKIAFGATKLWDKCPTFIDVNSMGVEVTTAPEFIPVEARNYLKKISRANFQYDHCYISEHILGRPSSHSLALIVDGKYFSICKWYGTPVPVADFFAGTKARMVATLARSGVTLLSAGMGTIWGASGWVAGIGVLPGVIVALLTVGALSLLFDDQTTSST